MNQYGPPSQISCTALSLIRQSVSKRKAWQQPLPSLCNEYEINGADNWYIIIKIPSCEIKRAKPPWHMHANPYSVMSGNRPNIVAESNRVDPTGFVPPRLFVLQFNVKYIYLRFSQSLSYCPFVLSRAHISTIRYTAEIYVF